MANSQVGHPIDISWKRPCDNQNMFFKNSFIKPLPEKRYSSIAIFEISSSFLPILLLRYKPHKGFTKHPKKSPKIIYYEK